MAKLNIEKYAETLYARINEAEFLNRAEIMDGSRETRPNMCHYNVTIWCEHKTEFTLVRGWLYFDLPGSNYVSKG